MRYQLLYAIAWAAVPTALLFSWWLETYSDSRLAEIMRGFFATRFASARRIARRLIWTVAALFGGISFLSLTLWGVGPISGVLFCACLALVLVGAGFTFPFPFSLPRWMDADWQWYKRHDLVDEKGNITSKYGKTAWETLRFTLSEGRAVIVSARLPLSMQWRELPQDTPSQLLPPSPATPLSHLLIVAQGPSDPQSGFPSSFTVTASLGDTDAFPSAGELSAALSAKLPGWSTLAEENVEPGRYSSLGESSAIWAKAVHCKGVYSDAANSYTVIQSVWRIPMTADSFVLITATATTTTSLFASVAEDISQMFAKLKVEL